MTWENPFKEAFSDRGTQFFLNKMLGISVRTPDEAEFFRKSVVAGIPGVGNWYKVQDQLRYAQDYMDNRNLSFSGIKYPYINSLSAPISAGVGAGYNFVSSNVTRLYR